MTDRVSRDTVESILEDYSQPQMDAALDSLGASRNYVADGRRRSAGELPDFNGPDSEFYEGVSEQEVRDFDQALSTIRAGYRIQENGDEDLVLNEEAMYDQIASGSIEFYAPWNVGMNQKTSEIQETIDYLQEFAGILNNQTCLDAQVEVYSLEEYAKNNENSFSQTKSDLELAVDPKRDVSLLDWSGFEQQVLGEELNSEIGYERLRSNESDLMSGNIRISPTENPDQEDKEYVNTTGNPRKNEAVIYGPFVGPWKFNYQEEVQKVPGLLNDMRSIP